MESIIFDKSIGDKPLINKPARFDMAINFYATIKIGNEYKLVTYYYNPAWNLYYPFYDDKNKKPVLKESEANTYSELIKETDETLIINENEKINLAIKRFKELIGCSCNVIESRKNHILYELKYSKTSNIYSIYKLFNYIVTDIEDINKLINPIKLKCKLYNINNLNNKEIVENAIYFVNSTKDELKKHAIKL